MHAPICCHSLPHDNGRLNHARILDAEVRILPAPSQPVRLQRVTYEGRAIRHPRCIFFEQVSVLLAAVQGHHVETISLRTSETDLAALQALGTVTAAEDPGALSAAFARMADQLTNVVARRLRRPRRPRPRRRTCGRRRRLQRSTHLSCRSHGFRLSPCSAPWWSSCCSVWPRQRVSRARLGIQQPKRMSEMGQRTISMFEEMARKGDLATNLTVANIGIKPGEFVALVAVIAAVVGLVGLLLGGLLLAVILAVVVCLGAQFYVQHKKAKRRRAFAAQVPDLLQLITTSLRSGYGITQALDSVAEEADEPARSEFAHVLTEARLGRDLSESLRAIAVRMDNVDLEWVIGAIDINRDTGGNLSETLGQVSTTVRDRERMQRQARTLTAEGRLSARILMALPLVMGLWQWRTNPDAFALLFQRVRLVRPHLRCRPDAHRWVLDASNRQQHRVVTSPMPTRS